VPPAFLRLATSNVYTWTQSTENTGYGLIYVLEIPIKVTITYSMMKPIYIIQLLTHSFIPPPRSKVAAEWRETATVSVNKIKLFRQINSTEICPRTAAVTRIQNLCISHATTVTSELSKTENVRLNEFIYIPVTIVWRTAQRPLVFLIVKWQQLEYSKYR
jgi:hypothetical protein